MVKCLQNALLFVIAILLVFGFYYHAEFYKLGWFGLLIIGSIITFSVLKLIIWLSYGKTFKEDFQGVLIFRPEEVEAIKHGRIKQIIRPERKRQIQPGEVYRAKLNIMSESYFSELFIMNIFTKSGDVMAEEWMTQQGREDAFPALVDLEYNKNEGWEGNEKAKVFGQLEQNEDAVNIVLMDDKDREIGRIIVDNVNDIADFYIKKLNLFDKFWFYMDVKETVEWSTRRRSRELFHADVLFAGLY